MLSPETSDFIFADFSPVHVFYAKGLPIKRLLSSAQ